tara:strand:+ start:887 stop:1864 length:978 start_codon:yes stop_codon:yes gene_type:complete
MPLNNNIEPITLPMDLKFGQTCNTTFQNNLEALKVELIDAPSREQAHNVAWCYTKATWADDPHQSSPDNVSTRDKSLNLIDVLNFRALPTPMECLGFTFRISGISLQTVTHLIRHRAGSFAAQCTGDRDLRDDPAVVPEAIENSPEFYNRYQQLVNDTKQLYADMVDSKVISMMDARIILPKCLTSFYYARFNIKDLIGLVRQRQDVQIQPEVDNILATQMACLICERIPEFSTVLDFNRPDVHYIKTFRVKEGKVWTSKGTNLYQPEPKNDSFDYHEQDTIYPCRREALNGTNGDPFQKTFTRLWDADVATINTIRTTLNEENA